MLIVTKHRAPVKPQWRNKPSCATLQFRPHIDLDLGQPRGPRGLHAKVVYSSRNCHHFLAIKFLGRRHGVRCAGNSAITGILTQQMRTLRGPILSTNTTTNLLLSRVKGHHQQQYWLWNDHHIVPFQVPNAALLPNTFYLRISRHFLKWP